MFTVIPSCKLIHNTVANSPSHKRVILITAQLYLSWPPHQEQKHRQSGQKLNEDLLTFIEKLNFFNLPKLSITSCAAIVLPSALINNLGFSLQVVRLICTMLMFLLPYFLTSSVCKSLNFNIFSIP